MKMLLFRDKFECLSTIEWNVLFKLIERDPLNAMRIEIHLRLFYSIHIALLELIILHHVFSFAKETLKSISIL